VGGQDLRILRNMKASIVLQGGEAKSELLAGVGVSRAIEEKGESQAKVS
jgi:hypothetical protein